MSIRVGLAMCGLVLWLATGVQLASAQASGPVPVPQPGLAVHFLNAGAGDAAWAVLPDGSSLLVDCGPPEFSRKLVLELQAAGLTTIDLLAPSRFTSDASGGCDDVLRYLRVGSVLWSAPATPNAIGNQLDADIAEANINRLPAAAGWTRSFGNARLTVLNPASTPTADPTNDSQVLLLEYGASAIVFAGGIHEAGENQVLSAISPLTGQPLLAGHSITVLRAADHGVGGTSQSNFLAQLFPSGAQNVVLSYSSAAGAAQPSADVRTRLSNLVNPQGRLLETPRTGNVTVTIGFDGSSTASTER